MTRLILPVLFAILGLALVPLGVFHPDTLVMRKDAAMPWDVPLALGVVVLLWAAFFVNTWCALLAPAVFLLVAMFWYIPHEERRMRETFGSAYDDYAWTTRRWI